MTVRRFLLAAACLVAAGPAVFAADIRVPEEATLGEALDAAQPGDRVIVTGGRWRGGRIVQRDVTLVGIGARLSGVWEITGLGATVRGVTFIDADVRVTGDVATFRGCRFLAPRGRREGVRQFSAENVSGLVIEDCRSIGTSFLGVRTPGLIFRGNRLLDGQVEASGSVLAFEDNLFTGRARILASGGVGIAVSRNRMEGGIFLSNATRALIEDNVIAGGAVFLEGADGVVRRNRLSRSWAVDVLSEDAEISGNVIGFRDSTGNRSQGFRVAGAGARVTDNVVSTPRSSRSHWGVVLAVLGPGPIEVRRNRILHVGLGGIRVTADGATVASNVLEGVTCAYSIWVDGASCAVTDNDVSLSGPRVDPGDGIVVVGAGAVLTGNSVSGASRDGIFVSAADCTLTGGEIRDSGRCGITIDALGTSLDGCVVSGARWAALYLRGAGTTAAGSSFTGAGRVDVLDLAEGTDLGDSLFGKKSTNERLEPPR